MEITKKSRITGQLNTMDVDIDETAYDMWLMGEPLDLCAPELSPKERAFMQDGVLPEEWQLLFPDE